MIRPQIRRILKKWVYEQKTEYNGIYYAFIDIRLNHKPKPCPFSTHMTPIFESLVDEVYKMTQEEKNEEKDRSYKG